MVSFPLDFFDLDSFGVFSNDPARRVITITLCGTIADGAFYTLSGSRDFFALDKSRANL